MNQSAAAAMFGPLAIGGVLTVLVYMGGHVSGAHYNPAVSLAFFLRGGFKFGDLVAYWIAQFGAACLAAVVVSVIIPNSATDGELATNSSDYPIGDGWSLQSAGPWLIEVLFTFALVLVIFNVAVSAATTGNSHYGLAIGFTVMAAAYAGGHISGSALNPAVGVGPNLIKLWMGGDAEALRQIVLYVVGPVTGAGLAVVVFKIQESSVNAS